MIKSFYDLRDEAAQVISGNKFKNYVHAIDTAKSYEIIDHINYCAAHKLVEQALQNASNQITATFGTQDGKKLKLIVSLTLAKLEIIKTKYANAGYDWSCLGDEGRAQMLQAYSDIDALLKQLRES